MASALICRAVPIIIAVLLVVSDALGSAAGCDMSGSGSATCSSGGMVLMQRAWSTQRSLPAPCETGQGGGVKPCQDDAEFVPLDGGDARVCRGANPDDNSGRYYTLFRKTASRAACKEHCMNAPGCKGIEYSTSGRCEVWTRTEGIEATRSLDGYTCLRYHGLSAQFAPLDGDDRACRGRASGDNSDTYYTLFSGTASITTCMEKCTGTPACKGIEYGPRGRCEVWTRPAGIEATTRKIGFTCALYSPQGTAGATSSTIAEASTTSSTTTAAPVTPSTTEAPVGFSDSWRVRVTEDQHGWKWDIAELELYTNASCGSAGKVEREGRELLESAHYGDDPNNFWSAKQAFDGRTNTGWGGRSIPDPVLRNLRFLGMADLPSAVRCLRIFQNGATKVAVERLNVEGRWQRYTEGSISSGEWSTIQVPEDPEQKFCRTDEHVLDKQCVPCPAGVHNDKGDDTLAGDSACDVVPVYTFDMGVFPAVHAPWTWFLNGGLVAQPPYARDMHSAACQDRMFVSWTSQTRRPLDYNNQWGSEGDTFGHMSAFTVGPSGAEITSSFKLDMCTEMGGVTANADCSVLAALCVSRQAPSAFPNFKKDVVAEVTSEKGGNPPFGWYEESDREGQKREVFHMYLLEWTGGELTATPSASVVVNKAIGGWRYGHWALSLNSAADVYSINLKTTLFGGGNYHEGDVHLAISRADGDFVYAPALSDHWACASGHTLWNALTYNAALDKWGRWCWTDGNAGGVTAYADWFRVVRAEGPSAEVYRVLPAGKDGRHGNDGGTSDLVSFGTEGWVGVLTGPESDSSDLTRLGVVRLPAGGQSAFAADPSAYGVAWLSGLVDAGKGAGWAKLAHVGATAEETDRFLLGWAQWDAKANPPLPEKFFLAEVDHTGKRLGAVTQVDNAGWGEKTDWVSIPASGCVAWPHVWGDESGPGGPYGSWKPTTEPFVEGRYSTKLHITVYCPKASPR